MFLIWQRVGSADAHFSVIFSFSMSPASEIQLSGVLANVVLWLCRGDRVTFPFDPAGDTVPKALHVSPLMDMNSKWCAANHCPAIHWLLYYGIVPAIPSPPKYRTFSQKILAKPRKNGFTSGQSAWESARGHFQKS